MGWAKNAGVWICLSAMAGLGALEALYGQPAPGLHAFPEATFGWLVRAGGVVLGLAAIVSLVAPRFGAPVLAACWVVAFAFTLTPVLSAPTDMFGYVPAAETAVFATFALWRWDEVRAWMFLRCVFGAMLAVFGAIHLMHCDTIASLIPDWMPLASYWPWLTGGGSVLAGLACLSGRGVVFAAGAVELMYASWLPLVHAPRLMAEPTSLFEWTFALTAVALAGVALAISGYAPVTTVVSGRPPHSAHEPS